MKKETSRADKKARARVYALYVYAAIIILVVVPQFFSFFSFGANKRMAECLCVGCSRFSRLASQQFSVLFQRVSKRWGIYPAQT